MNKNRIGWVDSLKGISVISVVLYHMKFSARISQILYILSVPIFFFMGGYLFNPEKYSFKELLVKRFKSLIIPYVVLSVFSIIVWILFSKALPNQSHGPEDFLIAFTLARRNLIFYNVPLWFFPAYFITELIYFIIRKYFKNEYVLTFLIALGSIASVFFFDALTASHSLPWSFDAVLFYISFFHLGYLTKKYIKTNSKHFLIALSVSLIWLLPIIISGIKIPYDPTTIINSVISYILFVISAVAVIIIAIGIALLLKNNKLLPIVSKQSILIVGLHGFFGFSVLSILVAKLNLTVLNEMSVDIKSLIFACISLLASLVVIFSLQHSARILKKK